MIMHALNTISIHPCRIVWSSPGPVPNL
jgi:hypothetical protein